MSATLRTIKYMLLSTRMKSFYWRTGMMILAVVIDQLIMLVSSVGLSPQAVVVLGLILGEISKGINNALSN